jgi:hypothetical protein
LNNLKIKYLDGLEFHNFDWDSNKLDQATSIIAFRVYNIGINNLFEFMDYHEVLESSLGNAAAEELLLL